MSEDPPAHEQGFETESSKKSKPQSVHCVISIMRILSMLSLPISLYMTAATLFTTPVEGQPSFVASIAKNCANNPDLDRQNLKDVATRLREGLPCLLPLGCGPSTYVDPFEGELYFEAMLHPSDPIANWTSCKRDPPCAPSCREHVVKCEGQNATCACVVTRCGPSLLFTSNVLLLVSWLLELTWSFASLPSLIKEKCQVGEGKHLHLWCDSVFFCLPCMRNPCKALRVPQHESFKVGLVMIISSLMAGLTLASSALIITLLFNGSLGDVNLDATVLVRLVVFATLNIITSSYTFFTRLGKGVYLTCVKYQPCRRKDMRPGDVG